MLRRDVFASGAALALFGWGCVLLTAPGCFTAAEGVEAEYDEVYVDEAPPPPQAEEPPAPPEPDPEVVWVDGYWYWTGARYVWVNGYWGRPPVVGHVWMPGGYVVVGSRYRYVPGRWAPPTYRRRLRYVHPRPAPRGVRTRRR